MKHMQRFKKNLRQLEDIGRRRNLRLSAGTDLSSNDYLLFSTHPALRRVAQSWDGPIGAGGSRLLRGNHPAHENLEQFAAEYFGTEKALYFSNGFQANQMIFSTLPDRHDVIVYDALIHASARYAMQATPATAVKFRHNDLNDCEEALKRARDKADYLWLAVESVYSMDGDMAPLKEMHALCLKYDAWLIVDEAHATGVFGATGRGLTQDLPHDRLIVLHTGGKALGVAGGLVCGPAEIIDTLVNKAPSFIYSTAPLPLQAALLHSALQLSNDEPQHRARLRDLCAYMKSPTQIIPVILGDDKTALQAAETLQLAGFDVRAIRPPTVPEGTARLRLSLNAGLTEKTLSALTAHLAELRKKAAA